MLTWFELRLSECCRGLFQKAQISGMVAMRMITGDEAHTISVQ
jgi:hypothetical protein